MGRKRKTLRDYYALAKSKGFEWIGEEAPYTRGKTWWRCSEGHEWEARYNSIQQGSGCPHCCGNALRTSESYHSLAESKGFKWIGKELPKNVDIKTTWRCPENHEWEACCASIRKGTGCPHCYGNVRKTSEDYHELAESKGFKWIGEEPPGNVMGKTWWQCSKGDKWEARYNDIRRGKGCPHCSDLVNGYRVSKPQRQICEMLGGELNYRVGLRAIDVALPDKKIAIEYDCWFWHGHKQEEDAHRVAELIAAGWKVLCIKTNKAILTHCQLDTAITKLDNGETYQEIVLDDWAKCLTFAEVRAQKNTDPWTKGPIPVNLGDCGDGPAYLAQQLTLWKT